MSVIVLDIGSSSVRAMLFDDTAQLIEGASVAQPHQFATDGTGMSVADAVALQTKVEACIDDLLTHPVMLYAPDEVRAVGMATFASSLVGVDRRGVALTPVYTYADTRSNADLAALGAQVDTAAAYLRTGTPLHTAYLPAKLAWLRRNQPELYDSVALWCDFSTYLYRQWFGLAVSSYSVAAWSGLLDRQTLTWDTDWRAVLELPAQQLPPLADYTATLTGLRPVYGTRWGAVRSVPFYLAVGDGAAANIGLGAVSQGDIGLTVGTTAALRVVSRTLPTVPDGLWSYRIDAKHHLTGGATNEGGNVYQWAKATFALDDDEVELALTQRPADAHGLTWLPLLAGERSPGWRADAAGTLHGIRLATTPLDICQALLESVALRLALIAEQLTPLEPDDALPQVYAGGGALSASPAWAQLICNALDTPLMLVEEPQATGRGVAIL
ncbi:MAG: gluconokinase, partial [Armatimonadetes bacterium]|nr:gluconokinase [Anaerolineae bacterium]